MKAHEGRLRRFKGNDVNSILQETCLMPVWIQGEAFSSIEMADEQLAMEL